MTQQQSDQEDQGHDPIFLATDFALEADRVRFLLEFQALLAWPREPDQRRQFLCVFAAAALSDYELELKENGEAVDDEVAANLTQAIKTWEEAYQHYGGRLDLITAPSIYDLRHLTWR